MVAWLWRASALAPALVLLLLGWPWRASAQQATWEQDGLAGHEVRALVRSATWPDMVGLVSGAQDSAPLWLQDARGWSQPPGGVPDFILAMAEFPEGGVLLGTGRNIADQPGVFLVDANPPRVHRLYDAQAVGALAVAPGRTGSDVYAAGAPWADRDASADLLRRDSATGLWSTVLQGTLPCSPSTSYFRQVVVAPADPDTIFALEWCFAVSLQATQLWRTVDHGQTWQPIARTSGAFPLIGTVALDPTDPSMLYLAAPAWGGGLAPGVARSLDGGATWSLLGADTEGLIRIRSLLVDRRDPRRLFAGTEENGVLASDDRGETWQPLPGLEGLRVWCLVVDPDENTLYAATGDGVWRLALP